MRYKVVAIRDRAIDTYSQPVFVPSLGGAIRSFGDEVKRPHTEERPNPLNRHPEDYDLFLLGEFDDQTGVFDGCRPEQVAVGKDWVV